MKKIFILTLVALAIGVVQMNAQDVRGEEYRTMSTEQLQDVVSKANNEYDAAKKEADKAKSDMKESKDAYNKANKDYKKLSKISNQRKAELKKAEKALKLRSKLHDLSK